MSNGSNQETEVQVLTSVPNDNVEEIVKQLQASDRYISHRVIPESGNTSRIEVTVRKTI